jgi:hypothetical protein
MTLIDVIGILQYYRLWDVSYQSRLVMINGLLYHGFGIYYDNQYIILLRNYDVSVNCMLIAYNSFNNPSYIPYMFIGCCFFLLNSEVIPRTRIGYYHNENIKSLIHVIFVQYFFLRLLFCYYE